MDRVTCRYIKRDGSICGGICTRTTGCSRHWKLYEKNMKASPELLYKILGETFILKVCTLAEVWYIYINISSGESSL